MNAFSPSLIITADRSSRSAPRPHLLTATGRYDGRAIMALAHDLARADVARAESFGQTRRYKVALRDALRSAWSTAQTQHWCAARDAEQAAALALNNRTALLVAELRHDRMCASMIDSLPRHLAAVAAVAFARRAAIFGPVDFDEPPVRSQGFLARCAAAIRGMR